MTFKSAIVSTPGSPFDGRDHSAGIGTDRPPLKFYDSYMIFNVQVYHLHNTFMHYSSLE